MSAPTATRPAPLRRTTFLSVALMACLALAASCGGNKVTQEGAFTEIKPKAALPVESTTRQANNFVVRVDNVADGRTSFKNYVVLYVNGHEVAPTEGHDNLSATYYYSMRLQEGLYEVKAEYHAVGSWRKRVFDVVSEEAVRIMPNQRTLLEARLDKDDRGMLVRSPARFRARYIDMTPTAAPAPEPQDPPQPK